jgi:hypothetical protein
MKYHVLVVALFAAGASVAHAGFANGSFEDGTFSSWVTFDLAEPFNPMHVGMAGEDPDFGMFVSDPTDGTFAALHGFDGDGPGTISIGQDVLIDAPTLEFDYRGGWDMSYGGVLDRVFSVDIEPAGGGAALDTTTVLTAIGGSTILDTGDQTGAIDLSAFMGQTVRVNFEWFVSEAFTGPGFFQLDHVQLTPEPGTIALLALGGLAALRRR